MRAFLFAEELPESLAKDVTLVMNGATALPPSPRFRSARMFRLSGVVAQLNLPRAHLACSRLRLHRIRSPPRRGGSNFGSISAVGVRAHTLLTRSVCASVWLAGRLRVHRGADLQSAAVPAELAGVNAARSPLTVSSTLSIVVVVLRARAQAFISQLVGRLEPQIYSPNDMIVSPSPRLIMCMARPVSVAP